LKRIGSHPWFNHKVIGSTSKPQFPVIVKTCSKGAANGGDGSG
jgi:hypothetical protein